jgi:3-phosphoglycerate kinase
MLRRAEVICVGGVVANTLLAARSVDMKESVFERDQLAVARNVLTRARDQKVELVLPVDALVGTSGEATEAEAVSVGSIRDGYGAFDIGPRTLDLFRARVQSAKTVLWHGTLGVRENEVFSAGTSGVLSGLAEAPAFGILIGDSVAAAATAAGAELENQIGFVSTGGAASLVFIEGKKLPGAVALRG